MKFCASILVLLGAICLANCEVFFEENFLDGNCNFFLISKRLSFWAMPVSSKFPKIIYKSLAFLNAPLLSKHLLINSLLKRLPTKSAKNNFLNLLFP